MVQLQQFHTLEKDVIFFQLLLSIGYFLLILKNRHNIIGWPDLVIKGHKWYLFTHVFELYTYFISVLYVTNLFTTLFPLNPNSKIPRLCIELKQKTVEWHICKGRHFVEKNNYNYISKKLYVKRITFCNIVV